MSKSGLGRLENAFGSRQRGAIHGDTATDGRFSDGLFAAIAGHHVVGVAVLDDAGVARRRLHTECDDALVSEVDQQTALAVLEEKHIVGVAAGLDECDLFAGGDAELLLESRRDQGEHEDAALLHARDAVAR